MTVTSEMLGQGLVVVVVACKGVWDVFGGKKRDRRHGEALDRRFATLDLSLEQRFNGVSREVGEVRAFVVGPDGENGIRGDLREVKARLIGLEERERNRDRVPTGYDRRATT